MVYGDYTARPVWCAKKNSVPRRKRQKTEDENGNGEKKEIKANNILVSGETTGAPALWLN